MILDSLSRASLYRSLSPGIAAGLDWLAAFDPETENGRYEIDGDRVYAVVQRYDTAPSADKRFEAHRRYLDIQYVVSGRERILHAPLDALELQDPHNPDKDVAFYRDPAESSSLLLLPGDFTLLFPADGHKPGCMAGARDAVTKVVVKVEV